jgi:hypothetical protein
VIHCTAMPRKKGVIPRVAVERIAVQIEKIFQAESEGHHRAVNW